MEEIVVYYDGKTLENKINYLKSKLVKASNEEKVYLENDIRKYEYGLKGESRILYELKHSHIPMLILHDLNICYKDYKAQIDYILMTNKNIYILECKNLYGNLIINEEGNFYRVFNNKTEAIYNPITQLNRHMDIMKEYIYDQNGIIGKLLTNYAFDKYYKGIVVLTNDRMVIKEKGAPKKVKDRVVRLDKLIEYIKKEEKKSRVLPDTYEEIKALADKILKLNVPNEIKDEIVTTDVEYNEQDLNLNIILRNKLKQYRFRKSQELKYKPYFIFNDKTLDELVKKKPFNKDELKNITGFSDVKVNKYGKEILRIINN